MTQRPMSCLMVLEETSTSTMPAIANRVIPIRVFTCTACGYTELYNSLDTDPERWGLNGADEPAR